MTWWGGGTRSSSHNLSVPKGISFVHNVMLPAIEWMEQRLGLKPLTVHLYPEPATQTEEEDFYWWSYPPVVNDWLVRYAEENKLTWRRWKPKK